MKKFLTHAFVVVLVAAPNLVQAKGTGDIQSGVALPLSGKWILAPRIRCTGINKNGDQIGMEIKFDAIDRVEAMNLLKPNATTVIKYEELGSPSHFMRIENNKLQIFGFKSFNDGLEENISITYVDEKPELSVLRVGYGPSNLAVKDSINCVIAAPF